MLKISNESNINYTKLYKVLITIFLLIYTVIILIFPSLFFNSASNGILLWATNVFPSLFPFFVINNILLKLNYLPILTSKLGKILGKTYSCSSRSGYIFLLSALSGYPMGAYIVNSEFQNNLISEYDAKNIISFSSITGPIFIIGIIGVLFLQSYILGIVLYISHIIAALLNGLLFSRLINNNKHNKNITNKNCVQSIIFNKKLLQPNNSSYEITCFKNNDYYKLKNDNNKTSNYSKNKIVNNYNNDNIIYESILQSIKAILVVGAFITIFYQFISFFDYINLFTFLSNITGLDTNFFSGLLELTYGAKMMSQNNISFLNISLLSFLISFGGLCVHMQSYSYIQKCNIKYKYFLFVKLIFGILSSIITLIILCLFF